MNLGERIYQLRSRRNMSQGDLAEELDVSRQSISKWENNSAVPELDKLVKLSAVFGVTLDELVKGGKTVEEPEAEPSKQVVTVIQRSSLPPRKIAGIVLFSMAFIVVLVCMVMGGAAGRLNSGDSFFAVRWSLLFGQPLSWPVLCVDPFISGPCFPALCHQCQLETDFLDPVV